MSKMWSESESDSVSPMLCNAMNPNDNDGRTNPANERFEQI